MRLAKPVIAAVGGYAVAGGLELALWADLRVADEAAVLGVFCRRWGVPLIDGGTVRLPRLIGQSHAIDLILTGRPVDADEAHRIGLVNRQSRRAPRWRRHARWRTTWRRSPRPACVTTGSRYSIRRGGRRIRRWLVEFGYGTSSLTADRRRGDALRGRRRAARDGRSTVVREHPCFR